MIKQNRISMISEILLKVKNEKMMNEVLIDIFTPQEIKNLAERIEILQMLAKNIPQREIASKLKCGIATVTRGSRVLKHGTGVIKKII